MKKRNIAFELIVLILIVAAVSFGVYEKFYLKEPDVLAQSGIRADDLIQNSRSSQMCTDIAPENAQSAVVPFTQVMVNGEWTPQNQTCTWSCNDGFREEGNSCVDINECNFENTCNANDICRNLEGGYVCLDSDTGMYATTENFKPVYREIYSSYPATNNGKESLFSFLEDGDLGIATKMLENEYTVSNRYESVELGNIDWEEDPYNERYWRFLFYSLRPTRHLLYSWKITGDDEYKDKLVEIMNSYVEDGGLESEFSWDDQHGVAYRTLVMINTWWDLREGNSLDERTSSNILYALERQGEFLENRSHFEHDNNHGITQAASLFLIGINFPDLPKAKMWERMGRERLNEMSENLVDQDGGLTENSPYYHFYTLRLFWNIKAYSDSTEIEVGENFDNRINSMITYGTYVLQPDLYVPTTGASLRSQVRLREEFEEIAQRDPQFLYVLTQGEEGIEPDKKSVYFPDAGETLMRSGWGQGAEFENQTYIYFDIGEYRTDHSDFDSLGFHLYGNRRVLLMDSGLYTYEERNKYRDYFHGTSAHNTVTVDDMDQIEGGTVHGAFSEAQHYTYQSGEHTLYEGVTHQRAMLLIEKDKVVIIDRLTSDEPHKYEQIFHAPPELDITTEGQKVKILDNRSEEVFMTMEQYHNKDSITLNTLIGQEEPYKGWCSYEYEIALPCHYISYGQSSADAEYITLLSLGEEEKVIENVNWDGNFIQFEVGQGVDFHQVSINNFMAEGEEVKVVEVPR